MMMHTASLSPDSPAPRRLRLLVATLLCILAGAAGGHPSLAANAPADSITLTAPNNTTVAESDDYATQVLGDPWDMNNPEDTSFLDHMTPPTLSNGIWTSQTTSQYSSIYMVSQGWDQSFEYLGEHNGVNYPVDSRRFTHLRFRMYSSVADRVVVWWFRTHDYSTPGGNSNFLATQPGWHIYDLDLTATGAGANGSWTAQPVWNGLRFDPIFGLGHAGATIQLDWVRLTPSAGSNVTVTWTASGINPVSLALATSPGGADEMPITSGIPPQNGNYTWTTAGIAPGTYYVHATMGDASSYSGPLNINQAPVLQITAPSTSSGEDYATTVLGTPWSMSSLSQLQGYANITNLSVTPSYLQASATNNDPNLFLLNNDPAHPIDTNRYHYFNFHLYLERATPGVVNGQYDQWNGGTRVFWSQNADPHNFQITQVVIGWYNRWIAAGMDLRRVPLVPGSNVGWVGNQTYFRFDPHEEEDANGTEPPFFRVGQFRLTADPTVEVGGATAITWVPGKQTGNVSLFYSTQPGGPGTQIGTAPLSSGGYVWNVPGTMPGGTYWISAIADDGLNNFGQVALVPLTVSGTHPCPPAYSDVPPAQPFYSYIRDLECRNIVAGYSDNTFRPGANATRGTLAQWIVLALGWGLSSGGTAHFSDVPASDPLYPYVETAYAHNVLNGYADGTFHPYDVVTRGQMSKMIVNAMGWTIDTTGAPHFGDVDAQNPFYGQIETLFNHGAVSGYADGTFRWGNALTRGQLAKVLDNSIGP